MKILCTVIRYGQANLEDSSHVLTVNQGRVYTASKVLRTLLLAQVVVDIILVIQFSMLLLTFHKFVTQFYGYREVRSHIICFTENVIQL
jgi:hypothetical protein